MHERDEEALWTLIEATLNGELTSSDCARLEAILEADPRARRRYILAAALDADLWLETASNAPPAESCAVDRPHSPSGARRRLVAAAAVAVLAAACTTTLFIVKPHVWGEDRAARLARTVDARFDAEIAPGAGLFSGHTFVLAGGVAELIFDSGVRAILEAPAALELESSLECRLRAGRMTVAVPGDVKGFVVRAAAGAIAGADAEYGLQADSHGTAEIHVFRGQVDIEPAAGEPGAGSAERKSIAVRQGDALRTAPEGSAPVPAAPARFFRNEKLTAACERVALQDDFSAPRLAPKAWKTRLPSQDSALVLDDGRVRFVNRGYLITAREFDPVALGGVRISGTWRFAVDPRAEGNARIDILSVMTRSDARVGRVYYEVRSGIEFQLLSSELVPRIRALGTDVEISRTTTHGSLRAEEGDLLKFDVIDDGRELLFCVQRDGDPSNRVIAAAAVLRDATREKLVVIHNRENPGTQRHVAELDDVVIATGVGACK